MVDVKGVLRKELAKLERERDRLTPQIAVVTTALHALDGKPAAPAAATTNGAEPRRPGRRAHSRAMKAYWAKRRKTAQKKAS